MNQDSINVFFLRNTIKAIIISSPVLCRHMKAVYGYDLPKGLKAVRTPNLEHSCILVNANIL